MNDVQREIQKLKALINQKQTTAIFSNKSNESTKLALGDTELYINEMTRKFSFTRAGVKNPVMIDPKNKTLENLEYLNGVKIEDITESAVAIDEIREIVEDQGKKITELESEVAVVDELDERLTDCEVKDVEQDVKIAEVESEVNDRYTKKEVDDKFENFIIKDHTHTKFDNDLTINGALNNYNIGTTNKGANYKTHKFIPTVIEDGVMEIGKYIDFHEYADASSEAHDYKVRLESNNGQLVTSGNMLVKGWLTCNSSLTVKGAVDIDKWLTARSGVDIGGNTTIAGRLKVGGFEILPNGNTYAVFNLNNINFWSCNTENDYMIVYKKLNVRQNLNIDTTLLVKGTSTFGTATATKYKQLQSFGSDKMYLGWRNQYVDDAGETIPSWIRIVIDHTGYKYSAGHELRFMYCFKNPNTGEDLKAEFKIVSTGAVGQNATITSGIFKIECTINESGESDTFIFYFPLNYGTKMNIIAQEPATYDIKIMEPTEAGTNPITIDANNNLNISGQLKLTNTLVSNDYGRIKLMGTAANDGSLEIATADDASEPIYVRQYSGNYVTVKRTLTLLDKSGNTTFPGTVKINGELIVGPFRIAHDGQYVSLSVHNGSDYKQMMALALNAGQIKYFYPLKSSQTVTHHTNVVGEIGTFCESTGDIYDGYDHISHTDCICNVRTSTSLNKRIVGIICSEDEFASHGDVYVKLAPGQTLEVGDILCPDENGYGKKADEAELMLMVLHAIPRPKITSLDTAFEGYVACFLV